MLKHNISIKSKNVILNTYIFSVVNYGYEAWTYNCAMVRLLNSFEIWCHRRALKIRWTDMVSNKNALNRKGLIGPCLTKELFKRKMEFAGHVFVALVGQSIIKSFNDHSWKDRQRKAA